MNMETTVVMFSKQLQEKREFPISHAQKLIDLQKKLKVGDWELKDEKFTVKNGTIQLRNNKPSEKPDPSASNSESN